MEKMRCENCPVFQQCFLNRFDEELSSELKEKSIFLTFQKGQMIDLRESQGLYCIQKGILKICHRTQISEDLVIDYRTACETMGQVGMLDQDNHLIAECITEVSVCFFPQVAIKNYEGNPVFIKNFNSLLIDELHGMSKFIKGFHYRFAEERVAYTIMRLKEKLGEDSDNYIAAPITRRDLAEMTSVRIESVFRVLARMKKKNWIEIDKQRIKILEEKKLTEFIERG